MGFYAGPLSAGSPLLMAVSPSEGASLIVAGVSFLALVVLARYAFLLRAKNAQLEADVGELEAGNHSLAAQLSPVTLLENEWKKLVARYSRSGEQFSLVILDVGDAIRPTAELRAAVAEVVSRALGAVRRTEDSLYQLDARTFAALLAGCGASGARVFIDRVRSRLSNEPVRDEAGTTYISITAGVAEWGSAHASLDDLIAAARRDRETFSDILKRQLAEEFTGEFSELHGARPAAR
ncbi:MAG: hypothetical protein C0506_11430 [Anaerolinea sp.]|nr:hypothetical protein [Anaerolinea sp.]